MYEFKNKLAISSENIEGQDHMFKMICIEFTVHISAPYSASGYNSYSLIHLVTAPFKNA